MTDSCVLGKKHNRKAAVHESKPAVGAMGWSERELLSTTFGEAEDLTVVPSSRMHHANANLGPQL